MTSQNPSRRPTAKIALERFRALRSTVPSEKLLEVHELELIDYSLVPRSFIVMLRDLIETRQWTIAYRFTWISLKMWCANCADNGIVSLTNFQQGHQDIWTETCCSVITSSLVLILFNVLVSCSLFCRLLGSSVSARFSLHDTLLSVAFGLDAVAPLFPISSHRLSYNTF